MSAYHPRRLTLLLMVVLTLALSSPAHADTPPVVDLRAWQTPIRSQGGRGTCIVHSIAAGMEAALRRAGYGSLDLSEDTFMYFVKEMWLAPTTDKTADTTENQVGGTDGGNGVENL